MDLTTINNGCAVITGAASGIGLAMVGALAAKDINVVMVDIEEQALHKAIATINQTKATLTPMVADVSNAEQMADLAQTVSDKHAPVQFLFNNAGVFCGGASWESTLAEYKWLMDVNVWGVIHGIHFFVPQMIATGLPGYIVNTASMAALTALPFSSVYNMTKHAVFGLAESLYHELSINAPQLKTSVLCPELVATSLGFSERNRPTSLSNSGDITDSEASRLTLDSLRTGTADKGISPTMIAERVMACIEKEQFYILADDGSNGWHHAAKERFNAVFSGAQPPLIVPED